MSDDEVRGWVQEFPIYINADLDLVINQERGWPVGTTRRSPAEFRRRLLGAVISYQLQLRSIDYALKRYVPPNLYDDEPDTLGAKVDWFLKQRLIVLEKELGNLHRASPTFGEFGAEFTLFRFPFTLDVVRTLASRGLLLETLPVWELAG